MVILDIVLHHWHGIWIGDLMTIESIDEIFKPGEDTTIEKIMNSMVTLDDNIILKTELPNPMAYTQLQVLGNLYLKIGLEECGRSILDFCDNFAINMVSNKRKRCEEIDHMVSSINAANSQTEVVENRWFGNLGKKE